MNYSARIALVTMIRRESQRVLRTWLQNFFPPLITTSLYFIVFGHIIGSRVGSIDGVTYIKFIAPGLILMGVMFNSFSNCAYSLYLAKFARYIEELLVSPMSPAVILTGFMTGGVIRGLMTGLMVTIVTLFFTNIHLYSFWLTVATAILAAIIFSLFGLINGTYSKNFEQISIVPTFILTPLMYLGGIFYSLDMLQGVWRTVAAFNPLVYIIEAFRYAMLGIGGQGAMVAYVVMIATAVVLFVINSRMIAKGVGIRD